MPNFKALRGGDDGSVADVKLSDFMPRYLVYHSMVAGMSLHVRTRWSMSFTTAKEDIVKIDVDCLEVGSA